MSKILVIDDERSIRNTLKDILEYEKYEVDLAEDRRDLHRDVVHVTPFDLGEHGREPGIGFSVGQDCFTEWIDIELDSIARTIAEVLAKPRVVGWQDDAVRLGLDSPDDERHHDPRQT